LYIIPFGLHCLPFPLSLNNISFLTLELAHLANPPPSYPKEKVFSPDLLFRASVVRSLCALFFFPIDDLSCVRAFCRNVSTGIVPPFIFLSLAPSSLQEVRPCTFYLAGLDCLDLPNFIAAPCPTSLFVRLHEILHFVRRSFFAVLASLPAFQGVFLPRFLSPIPAFYLRRSTIFSSTPFLNPPLTFLSNDPSSEIVH